MKKIKIFIIFISSLLITGCWNYNELNDLAITTGVSIDKEGENYSVSYMIANAKKAQTDSQNTEVSTVVYTGVGNTISKAVDKITLQCPKLPYIGHLQIIIFSEEIANEGISNSLDYFIRNPESRNEFLIALSKNVKASEILKILSPLEPFPAQNIVSNIIESSKTSPTVFAKSYSEFVSSILKEGANPVLNGVEILGDIQKGQNEDSLKNTDTDAKLLLSDIGVFKKDKLLGWVDEYESNGINIINNNVKTFNIQIPCDDLYVVSTVSNPKSTININLEKEKPEISIDFNGELAIAEINCKRDLYNNKIINEIEKQFEEEMNNILKTSLQVIQKKYKTDIFNFGNMIYKEDAKYWNKIKDNWEPEIFSNVDIAINSKLKLVNVGTFDQTIKEKLE